MGTRGKRGARRRGDWQNGFKIDGMPYNGYGITMPYEQLGKVELLRSAR